MHKSEHNRKLSLRKPRSIVNGEHKFEKQSIIGEKSKEKA